MDPPAIVRCILDSLSAACTRTLTEACALANSEIDIVHIVGGGSQNRLLCQLTADAANVPVLAGPTEATALGNIVVQVRSCIECPPSLEALRASIAASVALTRYEPRN